MDDKFREWREHQLKKFAPDKPPLWTRVLWEDKSPNGPYHPNVVKEGVVLDPKYLTDEHTKLLIRTTSLVAVKLDDGKVELVYASQLVY